MTNKNPWNLTDAEQRALDGMADTGNVKAVALIRGRSHKTIENQILSARRKMKANNVLLAVLKWERYRMALA